MLRAGYAMQRKLIRERATVAYQIGPRPGKLEMVDRKIQHGCVDHRVYPSQSTYTTIQ